MRAHQHRAASFRPTVFLSASVPSMARAEEFRRVQNAQVEIEQATIALARAVLSKRGTLVLGAHPSIVPLVAHVAGEFIRPGGDSGPKSDQSGSISTGENDDPAVLVHQVSAFEAELPEATRYLARMGLARFIWHETVAGDKRGGPSDRPYPLSLNAMRVAMLESKDFDAMVCIGGMEGVVDEVRIFQEKAGAPPVLALAATGGAASLIAEERRDQNVWTEIDLLPQIEIPGVDLRNPTPYDFLMQEFIRKLEERRYEINQRPF